MTLLKWQSSVIPSHERSPRWYIIGGILVLAVSAYGILTGAWSLTLIAILCGGVYFLIRSHKPVLHNITLTEEGVFFDQSFTRWEDTQSFWIVDTPQYSTLRIAYKAKRREPMTILLDTIPVSVVRNVLSQFLTELTDQRETWLDFLIRTCKL